jgi:hypothetical protein
MVNIGAEIQFAIQDPLWTGPADCFKPLLFSYFLCILPIFYAHGYSLSTPLPTSLSSAISPSLLHSSNSNSFQDPVVPFPHLSPATSFICISLSLLCLCVCLSNETASSDVQVDDSKPPNPKSEAFEHQRDITGRKFYIWPHVIGHSQNAGVLKTL